MFDNPTKSQADALVKMAAEQMLANLGQDVQSKAQTVGAPVGPYSHGPGGMFGVRGLSKPVISTHVSANGSLAAALRVISASTRERESGQLNPLAPYITGFLAADADEPDGVCDDPPEAGGMKTCILTTQFGRKSHKTRQLEVNHVGQTINRGEMLDLAVVNSPLVPQLGGILANNFALSSQDGILAGREMLMRFVEVGVASQRWMCPMTFTGNPGNNSAGGGYKEFPGLDLLIGANKVDAVAGTTCPSLNSKILDFDYNDVQNTNAQWSMQRVITHLTRYMRDKAEKQSMGGVEWVLVMRKGLFDAIVDVWPCDYMSDRCQAGPNSNATLRSAITNDFAIKMREGMRNGKYLLVDERPFPVITDPCIAEETFADNEDVPNGAYSSDIYMVPLSIRDGAFPATFWEFYDYGQGAMPAVRDARATPFFWSDAGRYLWSIKSPDNWCLEAIVKYEPRLRLMTPQLAARITNVVYTPQFGLHFDDILPTQPYFLNGGISTGYPPSSPYSEWNTAGPGISA